MGLESVGRRGHVTFEGPHPISSTELTRRVLAKSKNVGVVIYKHSEISTNGNNLYVQTTFPAQLCTKVEERCKPALGVDSRHILQVVDAHEHPIMFIAYTAASGLVNAAAETYVTSAVDALELAYGDDVLVTYSMVFPHFNIYHGSRSQPIESLNRLPPSVDVLKGLCELYGIFEANLSSPCTCPPLQDGRVFNELIISALTANLTKACL